VQHASVPPFFTVGEKKRTGVIRSGTKLQLVPIVGHGSWYSEIAVDTIVSIKDENVIGLHVSAFQREGSIVREIFPNVVVQFTLNLVRIEKGLNEGRRIVGGTRVANDPIIKFNVSD
jgi:hypothetical protein